MLVLQQSISLSSGLFEMSSTLRSFSLHMRTSRFWFKLTLRPVRLFDSHLSSRKLARLSRSRAGIILYPHSRTSRAVCLLTSRAVSLFSAARRSLSLRFSLMSMALSPKPLQFSTSSAGFSRTSMADIGFPDTSSAQSSSFSRRSRALIWLPPT